MPTIGGDDQRDRSDSDRVKPTLGPETQGEYRNSVLSVRTEDGEPDESQESIQRPDEWKPIGGPADVSPDSFWEALEAKHFVGFAVGGIVLLLVGTAGGLAVTGGLLSAILGIALIAEFLDGYAEEDLVFVLIGAIFLLMSLQLFGVIDLLEAFGP